MFDIKADHITIQGPEKKRKVVTLGYTENMSHEGKVAAESYEYKMKCLAVLYNSTVEHIKESIDFWISDRAGDSGTLIENLEISSDKHIRCTAHVIIGADNAADKVFRNTEQRIGVHKLMSGSAEEKIYNSSSSIHRMGQIALTKLLSPSHANQSVSLYTTFVTWLHEHGKQPTGFK